MRSLLLVGVVVVIAPGTLLAWKGKLEAPSLAGKPDTPKEPLIAAMRLLQEERCGFRGGEFLNARQTMEFAGGMSVVPDVIHALKEAYGKVTLDFAHLKQSDTTFRIWQDGWADPPETKVTINLDCPEVDLTKLAVPVERVGGANPRTSGGTP